MADVHLLFPTPVYTNDLTPLFSEEKRLQLKRDMDSFFWDRDHDTYGNPNGYFLEDEYEDALTNKREFQELGHVIDREMDNYVHNFLQVSKRRHCLKRVNSWGNKSHKGDYTHEHNHSNSDFSGVYYVNVPPKSGNELMLHGFRSGPSWAWPNKEFDMEDINQYNEVTTEMDATPGSIIMFPSHLYHSVGVSESPDVRYCIAFNYVVDGEFGGGTNYMRFRTLRKNELEIPGPPVPR